MASFPPSSLPKVSSTAASYDQGTDIQPNVSWSSPPSNKAVTASTTSTTTTSTTFPKATPTSPTAALERNLNPVDAEDPRLQTKALPFAQLDSASIAASVVTSSVNESGYEGEALHNGNILDRTMDQIRAWVHSSLLSNDKGEAALSSHLYSEEVDEAPHTTKASSTVDAAKSRLQGLASSTSNTLQQVGTAASDTANSVSSTVRGQAGELQHRVGDALHTVGDKASATVQQVKSSVNDFIASHQSQPGEPLTTTVSNSLQQRLPSQSQVKETVSAIIPPLAQQASSSYAFLGSFVTQYASTYRDFFLALRRQSLPLQAMTGLLFVTHFVLPFFFFEKGPARSVIYCYVITAVLSHLTFFLSGHLRYLFLAHVAFIPMLISLTLHAGFGEASQANQLGAEYEDGNTVKALLIAPLSLRSYLFVLWLRVVLMVQASLLTLDAVNVLDMLGFSLDTRRGQEMALINRSVQQMRRQFAHNIAPPPTSTHASVSFRGAPSTSSTSSTTVSRVNAPRSASSERDGPVLVQSHERSTEGLTQRKTQTHTQHHPTYSINNQPL